MAKTFEECIESMPTGYANGIPDLEKQIYAILDTLPKINRDELRDEMSNMIVNISKNPTTFDVNEGLAKTQGYRDRLSEILALAQKEYKVRKRCLEMLMDAVNLVSKASSADKRRGEAVLKYPHLVIQTEAASIFLEEVEQMCSNMKSTSETISRQVSVMQIQLQIGERRQGQSHATVFKDAESIEFTSNRNYQYQGDKNWDDDF